MAIVTPLPDVVPAGLGLPPGSVPIEAVRLAIRDYRAGVGTADRLVAMVDRHGAALEEGIAWAIRDRMAEFTRAAGRLEALHNRISDLRAQQTWLRRFPSATEQQAVPLTIELNNYLVPVPPVLRAMQTLSLEGVPAGQRPRPRRRGASAAMGALADAGQTTTDVAIQLGIPKSSVWGILTGLQPTPPNLAASLRPLLGSQAAELVVAAIPQGAGTRIRPKSEAVKILQAAGGRVEDLAELAGRHPASVARWLAGAVRPPPNLAQHLEQLVGAPAAAEVLAAIGVADE